MKRPLCYSTVAWTFGVLIVTACSHCLHAGDWVPFDSKKHGFTVNLPSEPEVSASTQAVLSLRSNGAADGVLFEVDVASIDQAIDPAVVDFALSKGRDSAVKSINGELLSDCALRLFGKYPGRQFSITATHEGKPAFVCCRAIVVGRKFVNLRITRNGSTPVDLKDAMQFFGSFRIAGESPEEEAEPLIRGVPFGQWAKSDKVQFRLTGASIANVKVHRPILNEIAWSENKFVVVNLEIQNLDDRRILRMSRAFGRQPFGMVDDVQNVIRPINFGVTAQPIGQITADDDIAPESTVKTIAVFQIPPPKTEYLLVAVDMTLFGGKGRLFLKLPPDKVRGFARTATE